MESFNLYHYQYSLCSLQVRYTLAIAGEQRDGLAPMHIKEIPVDLLKEGQLDEFFLTKVNRKGQARPSVQRPYLAQLHRHVLNSLNC